MRVDGLGAWLAVDQQLCDRIVSVAGQPPRDTFVQIVRRHQRIRCTVDFEHVAAVQNVNARRDWPSARPEPHGIQARLGAGGVAGRGFAHGPNIPAIASGVKHRHQLTMAA